MLRSARPTAVNLASGVDRALAALRAGGPGDALAAALELRDDDIAACRSMARRGVELLGELCPDRARLTVHDDLQHRGAGRRGARHRARSCRTTARRGPAGTHAGPARPAPCCRVPGSPRGSWTGWVRAATCWSTRRPRRRWLGEGSTPCWSAPTGSPPTGTPPTRSAPSRCRWAPRTPGSRSWWSRPRPRWTRTPRPAATSRSRIAAPPRCARSTGCAPPRTAPPRSTRRSTSPRPSLITAIVTDRRVVRPPEPPGTRTFDEEEA